MLKMPQQVPLVKLVITTGEPAGIGPEVSVEAAKQFLLEKPNASITLLADPGLLKEATQGADSERLQVEAISLVTTSTSGILNAQN